jgi:hypothetical protein
MKIIINGADDAGMPEEMIKNCEKLVEWRIEELPKVGDDVDILYSEKDPLQESDELDDEAYAIYFSVSKIEPVGEKDLEKVTITLDLNF